MNADIADSRPFLTPEARALYLQILSGRDTAPADSPALDQLLGVRLVALDPHRPGRYQAQDVQAAVQQWQSSLQTMAGQLLAEATSIPVQLRELTTAYELAHPSREAAGVDYVTGYEAINERLGPLLAGCTQELLTAQPTGPRPAHMLALSYQRDLAVLRRGATMRTIYLPTVRTDGPTSRWAETMTEEGAQIRTSTDFTRVIVIDSRVVVTSVLAPWEGPEPAPDRAMFIVDDGLVRHFKATFERDWRRAAPWDGTRGDVAGAEMTQIQRDILRRLAAGDEQDAAAQALGVTRRTVSAHLARLREATGTRSLPQLLYWWGTQGEE
ncbi:LuxR C-terminal-related transcriptional regulator [Streptomyces sp. CB03911]|uniref:LuxR C-terminal-related transcriptional regulator n=1 Tax=Streptomyces sp. CB03911 TaxID=1804758 RepID=UPI00093DC661|nr:LuxR C-terminal-related transcriptional regulator [Streptomyces sp. CB03911]OKI22182.1 hypothetical protein A6A07_34470 [Streptomyces sp. CB03911]